EFNKTYMILGAISGFFIWLSFCIIFIPLVWIFTLINKNYYDYGISYLNPFLAILFFIMISTVYVSTNAVSGLFLGFIYKFIKGKTNG
ncbi:MAG: hypothetical protein LUE64_00395, partial [Candidatus Gastranaerophilales bacterium]|nr:hypothetical protein [Candidatus Gastranaerophilales bacterium]